MASGSEFHYFGDELKRSTADLGPEKAWNQNIISITYK